MTEESNRTETLITLTADIVAAHVTNNSVAVSDLPSLIGNVFAALNGLGVTPVEATVKQEPAVSIRASIKPDYIVCLEDGKKLKMLKRHLMTHYQLTPEDYRAKWNLPSDYPMVAPGYAATRRELAVKIGLGRKARTKVTAAPASAPQAAAKEPVVKAPVAEAPVAKAPVAKAPVPKASAEKTPADKTPVAKAPAAKRPRKKAASAATTE